MTIGFRTILGLLMITFIIARVVPIDPVLAIVGERATEAQMQAVREALGLDQPFWWQFVIYISDAVQGDLGKSIRTGLPVSQEIARFFPATLELATLGTWAPSSARWSACLRAYWPQPGRAHSRTRSCGWSG